MRKMERTLVRLGDRLNPILVKETRQALKSRQFLITFVLLLFCAWGWSVLGIARIGPGAAVVLMACRCCQAIWSSWHSP